MPRILIDDLKAEEEQPRIRPMRAVHSGDKPAARPIAPRQRASLGTRNADDYDSRGPEVTYDREGRPVERTEFPDFIDTRPGEVYTMHAQARRRTARGVLLSVHVPISPDHVRMEERWFPVAHVRPLDLAERSIDQLQEWEVPLWCLRDKDLPLCSTRMRVMQPR